MSKQDDQDFCIMVVAICALVLAFFCAIKTCWTNRQAYMKQRRSHNGEETE